MANQHVSQSKWNSLNARIAALGINPHLIQESFIKGSGKGGQKQNKSSSTVLLKYEGHIVKCGESRYRELNRYKARGRLCDAVDFEKNGAGSAASVAAEKIRRQKSRRKRRSRSSDEKH